eukprot:7614380-Alexandrium_andersonii.AAC.1
MRANACPCTCMCAHAHTHGLARHGTSQHTPPRTRGSMDEQRHHAAQNDKEQPGTARPDPAQ